MVQKPIRYPNSQCAELAIRLHRFEATKVAGPGSSRRKITDVLWTKEEAKLALDLLEEEHQTFDKLINSLHSIFFNKNHFIRTQEIEIKNKLSTPQGLIILSFL